MLKEVMNVRTRPSDVAKLLMFLVESGSAFLCIQFAFMRVVILADNAPTFVPVSTAERIIKEFFNIASVLYPLSIIIMVHRRWSKLFTLTH
ncbi:hypothetical protein J3R30DRAFT_3481007 [Lentinula aciculospora]|uniref:Uncharacterized protein n=1 Tax=Lentinula aciculospora TaxID=153920 RepID=A0A9W9ABL0_9AGAR|nr:hypothetical protein J3R30DRAFT_3481007 [Lentinula aciculospora]